MNYYYPPYPAYQPMNPQVAQQNMQQPAPQQTVQSGSLISVRSEEEARMYPIAPGNSVTFKDENGPYIYTKTMGFSQLDRPVFDKYKLLKEETQEAPKQNILEKYALKSDMADLANKLLDLQDEILALRKNNDKRPEENV